MKQMVVMVINNPEQCMSVLDAWEAAGATGITILESTGLVRIRRGAARDDLPLLPSLLDMMRGSESHHRTIFSVVDDEAQAQALIEATERTFQEMDEHNIENSGVLFVLPVSETHRFATRKARERVSQQ